MSAPAVQRAVGGLLLMVLSACGGGATQAPARGALRSPIIGGAVDDGDLAVVALEVDTLTTCSGALIGPSTVLTAGHCLLNDDALPFYAAFGTKAATSRRIRIHRGVSHPLFNGPANPYDFALLELAEAATFVEPLKLNTTPLTEADLGKSIRHIGFGVSDEAAGEGRGTKREVRYSVNRIDPSRLWSGAPGKQTCSADSGAPGMMVLGEDPGERIAGVVSDGVNCQVDGWDGTRDHALVLPQ